MANGRCRYHGGRTPKGEDWHRAQWPGKNEARGIEKAEAKIRDKRQAAKKRAEKLNAMTPEQREAHEAWQRSHKPGSAGERARRRADRKAAQEMRERTERPSPTQNAEAAELQRHIDALRARAAKLAGRDDTEPKMEGAFA